MSRKTRSREHLYDEVASEASDVVIRRYSTSFGLAASLLGSRVRRDVRSIYALVRVADEIVDGEADAAGLDRDTVRARLDALEVETLQAIDSGFSSNLVVHAFALTARRTGFGAELVVPFFESMRMDIDVTEHTPESFDRYVYGSAEVVGLMCLAAFLDRHYAAAPVQEQLTAGARRLGAAFQKINFLRDLQADFRALGRSYFPGISVGTFTEEEKNRILDDIDNDLRIAREALQLLPTSSRRAVALALRLFDELAVRLRRTPANVIETTRIRVPDSRKLLLAAGVLVNARAPRRGSVSA